MQRRTAVRWIASGATAAATAAIMVALPLTSASAADNLSLSGGADGSSKATGTSYGDVKDGSTSTYWSPAGATGYISVKWTSAMTVSSAVIVQASGGGSISAWRLLNADTGAVLTSGSGSPGHHLLRLDVAEEAHPRHHRRVQRAADRRVRDVRQWRFHPDHQSHDQPHDQPDQQPGHHVDRRGRRLRPVHDRAGRGQRGRCQQHRPGHHQHQGRHVPGDRQHPVQQALHHAQRHRFRTEPTW